MTTPEKPAAPESSEGKKSETMASNTDVMKTMDDATKMLEEFKNDYGVDLPENFFESDAQLNVNEIYNKIYDKVSLTNEKIIDAVASAFVSYVNTLRTFKKTVDRREKISESNLNMFKNAIKNMQYTEAMIHDPMGMGLLETSGLVHKSEIHVAATQTPSTVASTQPEERVPTNAETAEGNKINFVINVGLKVVDGQRISNEEKAKTLVYLNELRGTVKSYDMDKDADMIITAENGKIKVSYKPADDASYKIKERYFFA